MEPQLVSTIVIVHAGGKYLLVQRALDDDIFPGKWQNAGGKLEPGETIEQAAARELTEETGIQLQQPLQFVMSYAWHKSATDPWRLGVVMLTDMQSSPADIPVQLDDELAAFGWYDLSAVAALDTIGPDSPTGTLAQIQRAAAMLA